MNWLNKLICPALLIFLPVSLLTAQDETTVEVTGRGVNCIIAEQDAYNKALAQAGGTYYANHKEVVDRKIQSDRTNVLKTGNVLRASVTDDCHKGEDGSYQLSMKITISQTKLREYVESKGKSIGISGTELLRKKEAHEEASNNEPIIIEKLLMQLENLAADPFDFNLYRGDSDYSGSNFNQSLKISAHFNENFFNVGKKLFEELQVISLNTGDRDFIYNELKGAIHSLIINNKTFYFRNFESVNKIEDFFSEMLNRAHDFILVDGTLTELPLNDNELKLLVDVPSEKLFFPEPGTPYFDIIGKVTLSDSQLTNFDRINVISKKRKQEFVNNPSSSKDLVLEFYSETNPEEFDNLSYHITDVLDSLASNRQEGNISGEYRIMFNSTGSNKSTLSLDPAVAYFDKLSLLEAIDKSDLNPSTIGGKFLKTRDSISFDLQWNSSIEKVLFTAKQSKYQEFFWRNNLPYGKYTLEVKEKELNNASFFDKKIKKYNVRGPLTAIHSLIIPGWGTRRISYKEKSGWGRFAMVFGSLAVGAACEYLSRGFYDQYKDANAATSEIDPSILYRNADLLRKAAVVSVGIGASFYLFDFISVINKGFKNLGEKRKIKKRIKGEGSLFIQKSQLQL